MTRVRIHVSPAYRYLCRTKLADGTIVTEALSPRSGSRESRRSDREQLPAFITDSTDRRRDEKAPGARFMSNTVGD